MKTASRFSRWLLLLGAAIVLLFCMGANTVAAAAWIGPMLLLRYTRGITRFWHWLLVWGVLFGAWLFQFRGMVPMPMPGPLLVAGGSSLFGLVPYVLDAWTRRRLSDVSFTSTLVFPAAFAAVDFSTALSPYGSWGVWAYSQYGVLPLVQLCAVTGLYGVTFIVVWFASVANWAWENRNAPTPVRRGLFIYGAVLGVILLAGTIRLQVTRTAAFHHTERVAGLTADLADTREQQGLMRRFWGHQPLSPADLAALSANLNVQLDRLLERSEVQARAGAKLVFWSEGSGVVLADDEPSLLQKGMDLAKRTNVYLGVSVLRLNPETRTMQNKTVLVAPEGRIAYEYWKSRPVPGFEARWSERNGNPMRWKDTSLGRVGSFICFDLDFPTLIRQAGRARLDLLLVPSNDWRAIDPWHTHMATFRAVENGCSLIRVTGSGRSLAVDALGRAIAESDDFSGADHTIVAQIPTHGSSTLYSKIGDTFAWLCVAGTVLLLGRAAARKKRVTTE